MASVKSITFHQADNLARKGLVQAASGLLKATLHGQRAGDSVIIEFDDGTKVDHKIDDHSVHQNSEGMTVNLSPGKAS